MSTLPELAVFKQVSVQDIPDNAVVRIFSPDRRGFKQQKQPSSRVPVRVILATDLVNKIVAEYHATERALHAAWLGWKFIDDCFYLRRDLVVAGIGRAIDQESADQTRRCFRLQ